MEIKDHLLFSIPLHTLLLSIYPPIFVYSWNIQYFTFQDVLRSILISVLFFSLLLFIFQLILKNWAKSGLLSSLCSCLFFSFGHIFNAVQVPLLNQDISFQISTLLWMWLGIFLLASYLILVLESHGKITQLLNIASLFLIMITIFNIITSGNVNSQLNQAEKDSMASLRGQTPAESSLKDLPPSEKPDIYLIILDGYLRTDMLKNYFNYDNTEFIEALQQRGFYVAEKSHSNYLNTDYSFNTLLNLLYIHQVPKPIFNKIKFNLYTNYVVDFLNRHDYTTVVYDSGTGDTNFQNADLFLSLEQTASLNSGPINKFEKFFLRTTLFLSLFHNQGPDLDPDQPPNLIKKNVDQELEIRRQRIKFALDHLPDFSSEPGPHYLFSHIYLPHIPFLYGPDGVELRYHGDQNLYWYEVEPENYREYYTYQIDYLNQAVLESIDMILEQTSRPTVIVLQSDHGDELHLDRKSPTKEGLLVRSAILNAVYYSDQNYENFYPSMTHVNTFRLIFNHWFGSSYPLLQDQVYFHEHPLDTNLAEKPEFIETCPEFDICLPPPPDR